jgi:hypothetical protein
MYWITKDYDYKLIIHWSILNAELLSPCTIKDESSVGTGVNWEEVLRASWLKG